MAVDVLCFGSMTTSMQELNTHPATGESLNVSDFPSASHAFEQVLLRRSNSFYRCALRLMGNPADAEDAVQEAFMAAYKHVDQFKGQSQISTWMTAIVRNCAFMELRKRARQTYVSLDEEVNDGQPYFLWERLADGRPGTEEECHSSELNARLQRCAARLPRTLRRTFQLRVIEGLSINETARILGMPKGTVKAQLARARTKIARHMRPALGRKPQTHQGAASDPAREKRPA